MIPILYESTETAFSSNGLGRLRDAISVVVTEGRNDVYECDFEYPVTGSLYEKIKCGRIIAVKHDDSDDVQPFDIVGYSRPINGIVSFHAVHISYRQSGLTVSGTNINSLADAFDMLGTASPDNPFSYETDKISTGYLGTADGVPRSVRSVLGGTEGSILDAYGGEYEWDKWTVRLHSARGSQKTFTIRYGVNMIDYTDECDYSGVYSAVVPYWTGSDVADGQITVVGNMVSSGLTTYNGQEICVPLDLSEKFETQPTTAQLEEMAASMMLSDEPNLPSQTISVDFIRLQDSAEYNQFKDLLECKLCDSIKVVFPLYGMSGWFKIVKTVYNVLLERYESMELGTLSTSLSEALGITNSAGTSVTGSSALIQKTVTSSATTIASGSTSTITATFTLTTPYSKVVGVRGVYTNYNTGCTVSAFNISGDGAVGNTVTLTAYIFNKSSSNRSTTVTWDLMLSA